MLQFTDLFVLSAIRLYHLYVCLAAGLLAAFIARFAKYENNMSVYLFVVAVFVSRFTTGTVLAASLPFYHAPAGPR